jgi:hypothetical protein
MSEEYCPIKSIAVRSIPIKRIGTGPDGSAELGALKLTWLFRISGTRCGMLSLLLTFDFLLLTCCARLKTSNLFAQR